MATALITGASAGIGAEFASQLAHDGYDLVLVARREERLNTLASDLERRFGVSVLVIAADLSEPGVPDEIYRQTTDAGLAVDYLVNNAGASGPHLLDGRDWADQESFFRLMMTSVAQMCHLYVPDMKARGAGRVINVASVAGLITIPGSANYGPAKRYVVGLSEELNVLMKPYGVHVTALCPGFTHTEFHETAGLEHMKSRMPKRLWYHSGVVVRDGRRAVEAGRAIQISGSLYRLLVPLMRWRVVRNISARLGGRR